MRDGVEIKLELAECAWDVKFFVECGRIAMGPQTTWRDDQGEFVENIVAGRGFPCQQSLEQEDMECKEELCPRRVQITKIVEIWNYGPTFLDVKGAIRKPQRTHDQSITVTNSGTQWKVQHGTTQLEPNASTNPKDGKARGRQNRTQLSARAVAAAGVLLQGAAKGTELSRQRMVTGCDWESCILKCLRWQKFSTR